MLAPDGGLPYSALTAPHVELSVGTTPVTTNSSEYD